MEHEELIFAMTSYKAHSLKNLRRKSWIFGLSIGLLLLFFGIRLSIVQAQNVSINSARNCDANAVIWCGAGTVNELINKYDNGDGHNSASSISAIYNYFGVSSTDIKGMSSGSESVEAGSVTRSGNVYGANGNLVATDALTVGRQNITGSTRVDVAGNIFYIRAPSVSFVSSPLSAFVVMKDNQFAYAILVSCGNAVKATPVTPKPKPVAPKPKPAQPTTNICSGNTTNNNSGVSSQGGNCSYNNTVVQPPPQPSSSGQCTSLQVNIDQSNPKNITATATSVVTNGAVLQSANFNFGDNSAPITSNQTSQSHTYANAGTYTITATLIFSGNQVLPTSSCQANLTIGPSNAVSTEISPTPSQPVALVNTGPGNLITLFATVAIASSLGYWQFTKHRA